MTALAGLVEFRPGDDVTAVRPGTSVEPLTIDVLKRHAPDRHLAVVGAGGTLRARVSCWWTGTPALEGQRTGLLGHYAAEDDASAAEVLTHACALLAREGCTRAIGPMDGNTWRSYRFVVERGTAPPFFLEPDNPDAWPRQFEREGFAVLATYSSAAAEDLTQVDPRIESAARRLTAAGIVIRPLRLHDAEAELACIFDLSLDAFRNNYLYTPIGREEFLDQNRRVLPAVVPDLVLLAERGQELAGFLFAVPDVLRPQQRTLVIKTVAVRPGLGQAGLGSVLVALAQRRAHELGFRRAIHALMHEQNVSRNISARYASPMRRYALFSKPLGDRRADRP